MNFRDLVRSPLKRGGVLRWSSLFWVGAAVVVAEIVVAGIFAVDIVRVVEGVLWTIGVF